jgi:hypothetical protein
MRTPSVGDQYVSARNADRALGKALTWRVARIAKKADSHYVELEPMNALLPKKLLSVKALADARLFSRVQS